MTIETDTSSSIGRAAQLLAAATSRAVEHALAAPASPWVMHAAELTTARDALALFGDPDGSPVPDRAPLVLTQLARDQLEDLPPEVWPAGLGVAMVYLAQALAALENGS